MAAPAAVSACPLDRPLIRPDICRVAARRASVQRCCRSLMLAVSCCCCCHRCYQARSGYAGSSTAGYGRVMGLLEVGLSRYWGPVSRPRSLITSEVPVSNTPLGYAEVSEAGWNTDAAATASVSLQPDLRSPNSIVVTGICPRCSHEVLFTEPLVTYYGIDDEVGDPIASAAAMAAPTARDIEVICTCSHDHPGRAGDVRGCGASWVLHVEWDPS